MRRVWQLLLISIVLGGAGLALFAYQSLRWFEHGDGWLAQPQGPVPAAAPVVFEIERGMGLAAIGQALAAQGLIEHPRLWRLGARYRGLDDQLQAGRYEIAPGEPPAALLAQFVAGRVMSFELVIVEGSRVSDLLARLRSAPELKRTLTAPDMQNVLAAIGRPAGPAEGLFFPDTYRYRAGDTDVVLLRQAYDRMQDTLSEVWRQKAEDLPFSTPVELLTMASIIEKETGSPSDRAQISQVFVLRLKKKMRLQTDPTVIYGLGDAFDGDLKRVHLRTDTPYNSYTRHGLPPTPIALPGRAALEAAAHPADGDYLYFVSRGDGTSEFSKTLEAHNAAVRRYQLSGGQQGAGRG